MKPLPDELERYSRQILFSEIGEDGQRNIANSRVLLCGCGALGTVLAETMVRSGVGFVRLVDRDFVEVSNLQRQVLFDEQDVESNLPKAVAGANKLRRINSNVTIEPIVADVDYTNIRELADGVDLILDGTDNFEIRFLINDASLETGIPWIYAGCIGSHGQTMTVIPNETACLRCLMDTVPEPGSTETCDTAGILGPTVNVIASLQAANALKLLAGKREAIAPVLTIIDIWNFSLRTMSVKDLRDRSKCPACVNGERTWLSGQKGSQTSILCGRNAVQVSPSEKTNLSLDDLSQKLSDAGKVTANAYLLRLTLKNPDYLVTIFKDGRAIIKGTEDVGIAKAVYARYIGN